MFRFNLTETAKLTRALKTNIVKSEKILKSKAKAALDYSCNIFNVCKEFLRKTESFKIKTFATGLSLVICFSATAVVYATEYTSAVEVRYKGYVVGFASDSDEAMLAAESVIKGVHGKIDIDEFEFRSVTELNGKIVGGDSLVKATLDKSNNIHSVCGLYVDGILKATANDFSAMQAVLNNAADFYRSLGYTFSGFNNSVTMTDIYATDEYIDKTDISAEGVLNGEYGIEFLLMRVEEYEEVIQFERVVKEDANKSTSYKKISQKGVNGLRNVKAEVYYINGVRAEVNELESTVIKESVAEIATVGTKKTAVYHNSYCLASSIYDATTATMVFPVKFSNQTYISAFFGDGRNHKGLDIAAPYGSEIYAAADGVVTFAGERGNYGYLIRIDHGDGKTETLYSHNSKNLVKAGDKVIAGQLIAYVGRTGNATGNHLHFEVQINGKQVDAAPYVGLK